MEKVDCIIVGAGPAGSACALSLARKGIKTVVLERGNYAGEKNVASFVLVPNVLETIIPDFEKSAPLDRVVSNSALVALYDKDFINFHGRFHEDYKKPKLYTAYRSRFDKWFSEQAEKEGAELICGVKVDSLIQKDGRVVGVRAGNEALRADVVVGADGLHSIVARETGLYRDDSSRYLLGIKEVIELSPDIIEERFNLQKNDGTVIDGVWGDEGCFFTLYTNNDAVSLCLFCRVDSLREGKCNFRERFEDFKRHPYIESRIKGGKLRQYAAHMLSDGGRVKLNRLYTDGAILCGEAGGLTNFLYVGVPTVMLSGLKAAEAIAAAKQKGCYDAKTLSCYKDMLFETGLPRMVFDAKKFSNFMVNSGNEKMATVPSGFMKFAREFQHSLLDYRSPNYFPFLTDAYESVAAELLPKPLHKPLGYIVKYIEKTYFGYRNIRIRMSV